MHPSLTYPTDRLTITPWDPTEDGPTFDPRSAYVEEFWLGVLGPSTTWLLRRIANAFDDDPAGFELPLATTARALGLGDRGGRHSPFLRAVNRLLMFDIATAVGPDCLAVRRQVPMLNRRHLRRLDPDRLALHDSWMAWAQQQAAG